MFKFAVGDEVTLLAMTTPWPKTVFRDVPGRMMECAVVPQKMVVVERILRECYAAVQISYSCRMYEVSSTRLAQAVARETFFFTEPELVTWAEGMAAFEATLKRSMEEITAACA